MVEPLPATRASPRRSLLGVLAAAAVSALVAVPAAFCAYAAYLSFTGGDPSRTTDAPPDVPVGVLYTVFTFVLLTTPVLAGLATARLSPAPEQRAQIAWWAAAGVLAVLLAVTACLYLLSGLL